MDKQIEELGVKANMIEAKLRRLVMGKNKFMEPCNCDDGVVYHFSNTLSHSNASFCLNCGGFISNDKEITITWTTDDVFTVAKEENINITEQQAIEILQNIKRQHDASIGINWDVIRCHLNMLGT